MTESPSNSHEADAEVAANGNGVPANGDEKAQRTSGVRYGAMNWIGEFRVPPKVAIDYGAKLVIQSDRGIELGEQVCLACQEHPFSVPLEQIKRYVENSGSEFYRFKAGRILRVASSQDVAEHERLNSHVRDDVARCSELAAQTGLDLKVVTAEHLLGGERIVFYFRSEGRIDFRDLVRGLAQYYQTRIEMRQVGARDEARLIADYEVCGRHCCCKNFLKKLRPVTMRMAKLQKSTLDPSKVSGRCGRLRCCLRYEHEGYDELLHRLPRLGTCVESEAGSGKVIDRQVLTQLVLIRCDDERELVIPVDSITAVGTADPKPPEPTPQPRVEPASDASPEPTARGEKAPRPRKRRRGRRSESPESAAPTAETESAPRPAAECTSAESAAPDTAEPSESAPPLNGPHAAASQDDASERATSDGEKRSRRRRRRRRRSRRGASESGSA